MHVEGLLLQTADAAHSRRRGGNTAHRMPFNVPIKVC